MPADADQTLTNGLAGDEVVYEDSAATATANWQIASAQADHDNAIALAQADDDYAHGLDWNDYLGERAAAFTNLVAKQTTANNGFTEAMGAADATQTSSDAGVTLTNADQIADAVLADSIADDKAIDLYSRAESDAYDGQQKNDAQALWSQQTNDAIAYFNSLNNLDQSTPWGAQATAQAQAQMTLATTLAQAALTLTDASADAQDAEEDTEWDLQQSQSDTLAQLAHDQAYADAQATYNAAQSQAAATAALAAVDGYFATLPLTPAEGGLPLDESWIQAGLLGNAPSPFSANYDYMNNVDDISADGTMGWSWSVGPTGEPFALQTNGVLNGATFWTLAIQAPYDPPNPYAGQPNWNPPDDPAPVPPPPDGSWNETPPPVPDVGATVYAAERQLSAKPGDAPLARPSGAVPSDGSQPVGGGFSAMRHGQQVASGSLTAENLGITRVTGAIGNFFYNIFNGGQTTAKERRRAAAEHQAGFLERNVPKAHEVAALPDFRHDFQKQNEDTTYTAQRQRNASIVTAVVPGINDARDIYETVTGNDFVTGEELSGGDRLASVVMSAAPGASGAEIRAADRASKVAKGYDDLAEIGSDVGHLSRNTDALGDADSVSRGVEGVAANAADDVVANGPNSTRLKGIPAAIEITRDSAGRVTSAGATITSDNLFGGTGTTAASRAMANPDDAGHIIGRALGGPGGINSGNIIPQVPAINRGAFAQFEGRIAEQVKAGKNVQVRVELLYPDGTSGKPSMIRYYTTIDGVTRVQEFPN